MKTNYQFQSLFGCVYNDGNLVFSPDGHSLYSPVGNRVSCFDLKSSTCFTFQHENRIDTCVLALSPSGHLLFMIDKTGHALLLNVPRRTLIAKHHLKERVKDAQFAPNGQFILVTHGCKLQLWKTPGLMRAFNPFVLIKTYSGHFDDVHQVCWRKDSKAFVTASKDMTARVYTVDTLEGYQSYALTGHQTTVISAWFAANGMEIYTISYDGSLFHWEPFSFHSLDTTIPLTYRLKAKHYFNQPKARVQSTAFHSDSGLLVVGFTNGVFGIWFLPQFQLLHSFSFSSSPITSIQINPSGEWIALGCAELGQLMVWEWGSESFILKQQGHAYDFTTLAYHPQGFIASAGEDHKIKLWNPSGVCFMTLDPHTAPVQALQFAKQGQVLFSASLDGSIRAFDFLRYRNFKTYTTPSPVQFTALAVDELGELVSGGSMDTFEVFVWSVQTGQLLESLAGHTAPISAMAFTKSASASMFASHTTGRGGGSGGGMGGSFLLTASWDKSVRVWNVFERSLNVETLTHDAEVLALAVRPDQVEFASATLDGMITFWNLSQGQVVNLIEGRRDLLPGRSASDLVTAKQSGSGQYFTTLTYTSDGMYLLAAGVSNFVCLYHVPTSTLIRRFPLSHHFQLDGVLPKLNSKRMTASGISMDQLRLDLSDNEDEDHELTRFLGPKKYQQRLPGVQRGPNASERSTRPKIKATCVQFSSTCKTFAVASTIGLLIYSLDTQVMFDPLDLDVDLTPTSILQVLSLKKYSLALFMALRLNEVSLIQQTFESIPVSDLPLLSMDFPTPYIEPMLRFLAKYISSTRHVEYTLEWCFQFLVHHASFLKQSFTLHPFSFISSSTTKDSARTIMESTTLTDANDLRAIQKGLSDWQKDLSKLCHENQWTLEFLLNAHRSSTEFSVMALDPLDLNASA